MLPFNLRVKVWRGDNCGRCGADLTSEFRLIGYGPECCKHMGVDAKAVLAITDERGRLEAVRDMAHRHARDLQDQRFLRLLPSGSIARDYAAGHGLVSAA